MGTETEINVDSSGFDRLLTTISATTEESKKLGETMKKALLGEVLVSSLNRISSGLKDGVAKEAVGAASALVQGFAQGGPVGAAMAGAAVSVGLLTKGIEALSNAEREVNAIRLAGYRDRRAFESAVGAQQDAFSDLNRTRTSAQASAIVAEEEKKQAAARTAFAARNALAIKFLDEADAAVDENFREQLDIEAEQALALRTAEEQGRAARYESWQQDIRDFDAAQAVERDQELTLEKQHADAKKNQEIREETQRNDALKAQRLAFESDMADIARAGSDSFVSSVRGSVAALAALDAAQVSAALSSKDLGANMAAAALEATAGVLGAIAQEAAAKAAFQAAEGFGNVAAAIGGNAIAGAAAVANFQAAAAFGSAAVLAGGAAVALNTAAAAARPAPASGQQRGGTSGGSGGGVSIVVNTNRLFSTEAEIGAAVEKSRRDFQRYRGV